MDLIICKELIKNNISYGKVVTYNDIAIEMANKEKLKRCLFKQLEELWEAILYA